jgi:hypothetical protein
MRVVYPKVLKSEPFFRWYTFKIGNKYGEPI